MVFIGSELPYDVQARDHDWMQEHAESGIGAQAEAARLVALSHLRPRGQTRSAACIRVAAWARPGAVDFGCGTPAFRCSPKHCDVTRSSTFARRGDVAAADFVGENSGRPGDGACEHAARKLVRRRHAVRPSITNGSRSRTCAQRSCPEAWRRHGDQCANLRELEPHRRGMHLCGYTGARPAGLLRRERSAKSSKRDCRAPLMVSDERFSANVARHTERNSCTFACT